MKVCKEYLLENIFKSIEIFLDIDCQSKYMADFHILLGKLDIFWHARNHGKKFRPPSVEWSIIVLPNKLSIDVRK